MKAESRSSNVGDEALRLRLFAPFFGAFLGLSLLKFGNPPIMEKWVTPPADIYEFVLAGPWPIGWAYTFLGFLVIFGLFATRPQAPRHLWLVVLPVAWLCWQFLALLHAVDSQLANLTVKHFTACVACFYLGCFVLGRVQDLTAFWTCLFVAFCIVLAAGWQQHFGGLDDTRRYFFENVYPHLKEVPPEYLKKMTSTRIFSTLFYPNSLAGALLLLGPVMLVLVWQLRDKFTVSARVFLVGAVAIAAGACLFWSGSKGGWLLMLLSGMVVLLRMPFARRYKVAFVTIVLVIGLAGFFVKYAAFFEKGATSVAARFDYWRAALEIARSNPLLGTGPGTFAIPYQKIKNPNSEMTRLTHNDYLEQAADSGFPAFVCYAVFIFGTLLVTFPKGTIRLAGCERPEETDRLLLRFAVWLGLLSFSLQSLFEFNLYVPALSWLAFALFGWLLAMSPVANPIDKAGKPL